MSTEIALLRALLRFSRRAPATVADLASRVREDAREVQHTLASLARSQLVLRSGETTRLTMAGLAVAVAAAAQARAAAKAPRSIASGRAGARVVPMQAGLRRHRAA